MKNKNIINNLINYVIAIILCVLILLFIYNIGKIDITKPIIYEGDSISASYLMKTVDDTGWYLKNPYVGGAFQGDFYDYIMSDSLSMFLVKVISLFTNNVFLIYNLFYFLTYILVTITCLYSLTQLGVKKLLAITLSLLYAFLPFHQSRMAHIWLEPYFMLPLAGLVTIWIINNEINFIRDLKNNMIKDIVKNDKLIKAIIISLLATTTGLYYAFFTCCLYALAFLINFLRKSKKQQCLLPVYFILVTIFGVFLNVLPHVIYIIKNGSNAQSELVLRSASDAEIYGLKMIQLLLPRLNHRIGILANIANSYATNSPLTNENSTASLGIIGSIGFVLLMINLFNLKAKDDKYKGISLLNLGTLLIATIGGVGAIFSYLVKTPMRSYNRISLVIAFFSILYLGLLLSKIIDRYAKIPKLIYYISCFCLLFFGLYDQTVTYTYAQQKQTLIEYNNDYDFVNKIEASVPKGSMIYQLPHVCFPSGKSYALLKGYLNSDSLIWSYGSMQGRKQDLWEHEINNLTINDMIKKLSIAGYAGIYIDSALYDNQDILNIQIQNITDILQCDPIYSENHRLVYFNMSNYNTNLKKNMTSEEYKLKQTKVYTSIKMEYVGDFSLLEKNAQGNSWHWCGKKGILKITNPTNNDMSFDFHTLAIMGAENSKISVTINNEKPDEYDVSTSGTKLDLNMILKPGVNNIIFQSNAARLVNEKDPRDLVFYLWDSTYSY